MRLNAMTGLGGRAMIIAIVVAAAFGGTAIAADAAAAGTAAACVKVSVTAKPKLNTQAGSTETLQTTITSCASKFEVITLRQRLSIRGKAGGTFELYRHESVGITQHIPYRCCGTFTVTDLVSSGSGRLLAKAKASWTFA